MLTKRKIKFILLFVLILNSLFLFTNVYSQHIPEDYLSQKQELKKAVDLYFDYKYSKSIAIFKELTNMGNPVAESFYAECLIYGWGVKKDKKESQEIFKRVLPKIRKIAEQGDDLAQYRLGKIYDNFLIMGCPDEFNRYNAVDIADCANVAHAYMLEAPKWYKKSADQGNIYAQYELGDIYWYGKGEIEKDYKEALKWYQKAAEQGMREAQSRLANMYYQGEGVRKDYLEAFNRFKKLGEQGGGSFMLGYMYHKGQGVEKDYSEAYKWYKKAAEHEVPAAQGMMGIMYYLGEGVKKDYKEAFKRINKLAPKENGSYGFLSEIPYYLGLMYYNGHGTLKNFQKALECFKKSASDGNQEALNWLKKLAEQGNPDAQYELGKMYLEGKGVEKDEKESFKWIKKSADQGNTESPGLLGMMYYLGQGVEKDYSEAFKWVKKAVEKGNVRVGFYLGKMYEEGHGTLKDEIEAYKWISLACRDLSASESYSDKCKETMNRLESKLTKSERDEALKRLCRNYQIFFKNFIFVLNILYQKLFKIF